MLHMNLLVIGVLNTVFNLAVNEYVRPSYCKYFNSKRFKIAPHCGKYTYVYVCIYRVRLDNLNSKTELYLLIYISYYY